MIIIIIPFQNYLNILALEKKMLYNCVEDIKAQNGESASFSGEFSRNKLNGHPLLIRKVIKTKGEEAMAKRVRQRKQMLFFNISVCYKVQIRHIHFWQTHRQAQGHARLHMHMQRHIYRNNFT